MRYPEEINRSRLKCIKLKRLVKKMASRVRRREFREFLLTGKEPNPRSTRVWLD